MCWSLKPWINTLLCVCVCIEPLMLPALLKSFASFLGQCRCYYYYSWSHFFRGDRWCKKGIHTGVLCCQAVELAWTTACCLAPEPHWFTTTSSVSPVPFLGFFPSWIWFWHFHPQCCLTITSHSLGSAICASLSYDQWLWISYTSFLQWVC